MSRLHADPSVAFLDVNDPAFRQRAMEKTVVIWGRGEYAEHIRMTLEAAGIEPSFFCDDDWSSLENTDTGKFILPENLSRLRQPFIVIGSDRFLPIRRRLAALGIDDCCALLECLKYEYDTHLHEQQAMAEYFDGYEKKISCRILVEIYGNIGDIIIKCGIVRQLITRYGLENVHIVCDRLWGDGGADLLRLLSPNVISVNRSRFASEPSYRDALLRHLNGYFFKFSVIPSNVTYISRRRCFNALNLNVRQVMMHDRAHYHTYLPEFDAAFVKKTLHFDESVSFSPKGSFEEGLKLLAFPHKLPARYVSVCMGASNPIRCYDARKFAPVARYVLEKGYGLVMLGYGRDEEQYCDSLASLVGARDGIISYVSQLSVAESLYAVWKSSFFIGVESGMWNASYALDKHSVVLYGGGDYYGFKHPDPKIEYVIAPERDCFGCRWECSRLTEDSRASCLDAIPPEQIIAAIDRVLAALAVRSF